MSKIRNRLFILPLLIGSLLTSCTPTPSTRTIGNHSDSQLTVVGYNSEERGAYLRGGVPGAGVDTDNQIVFCAEPPPDTASARAFSFLGQLDLPKPTVELPKTTESTLSPENTSNDTQAGETTSPPTPGKADSFPSSPGSVGNAPETEASVGKSQSTAQLSLEVANNVVLLAQRTELVEVQRQSLYRLCELSANNSLDRESIATLTNEVFFTIRVLALAELAGTQNVTIPDGLLKQALTRTDPDLFIQGEGVTFIYNSKTREVTVLQLEKEGAPQTTNLANAIGTTPLFSGSVTASISCEGIAKVDNKELDSFAEAAGTDIEATYDNDQLRQELKTICMDNKPR